MVGAVLSHITFSKSAGVTIGALQKDLLEAKAYKDMLWDKDRFHETLKQAIAEHRLVRGPEGSIWARCVTVPSQRLRHRGTMPQRKRLKMRKALAM